VGKPFEIIQKGGRLDAETRDKLGDEIMLHLAALMPEERRGYYQGKPIEFTLTQTIN
jgi:1-acyl-sn-glycerol-3-phosphate acyltransferase